MHATLEIAPAAQTRTRSAVRLGARLRLARVTHWTKNLVCFLPLFCSGRAVDVHAISGAVIAFLAFCLAASAVYILNDLRDLPSDQLHPLKRFRPLPSGEIRRAEAIAWAAAALVGCGLLAGAASRSVVMLLGCYVILNAFYSLRLKHVAVVDAMVISVGFILRLAAGGSASGLPISGWLVLCAFFLSLFLAFSKRRAELNWPNPKVSREVLGQYSELMLDRFSNISATLAIASYAVFTVLSRPDHGLLVTCPPVVFGIFRYLMLLETKKEAEAPELVLLKDRPIQIAILLWLLSYSAVLYFGLRLDLI